MNKFKREASVEKIVGVFVFLILIALVFSTIVLSEDDLFRKSYDYEVHFSEIGGLREGDNVFLRGMNVGRVRQAELQNGDVAVFIRMDTPVHFREGYRIEVVSSSMLGGKSLKIYEGPASAPVLAKGTRLMGEFPVDVMDQLSVAVDGIQSLVDQVNRGEGTLGKLIQNDDMYENLLVLSDDLKLIGNRLARGEGTVGRLLKEDDLYEDLRTSLANVRVISDRLAKGEGVLES